MSKERQKLISQVVGLALAKITLDTLDHLNDNWFAYKFDDKTNKLKVIETPINGYGWQFIQAKNTKEVKKYVENLIDWGHKNIVKRNKNKRPL